MDMAGRGLLLLLLLSSVWNAIGERPAGFAVGSSGFFESDSLLNVTKDSNALQKYDETPVNPGGKKSEKARRKNPRSFRTGPITSSPPEWWMKVVPTFLHDSALFIRDCRDSKNIMNTAFYSVSSKLSQFIAIDARNSELGDTEATTLVNELIEAKQEAWKALDEYVAISVGHKIADPVAHPGFSCKRDKHERPCLKELFLSLRRDKIVGDFDRQIAVEALCAQLLMPEGARFLKSFYNENENWSALQSSNGTQNLFAHASWQRYNVLSIEVEDMTYDRFWVDDQEIEEPGVTREQHEWKSNLMDYVTRMGGKTNRDVEAIKQALSARLDKGGTDVVEPGKKVTAAQMELLYRELNKRTVEKPYKETMEAFGALLTQNRIMEKHVTTDPEMALKSEGYISREFQNAQGDKSGENSKWRELAYEFYKDCGPYFGTKICEGPKPARGEGKCAVPPVVADATARHQLAVIFKDYNSNGNLKERMKRGAEYRPAEVIEVTLRSFFNKYNDKQKFKTLAESYHFKGESTIAAFSWALVQPGQMQLIQYLMEYPKSFKKISGENNHIIDFANAAEKARELIELKIGSEIQAPVGDKTPRNQGQVDLIKVNKSQLKEQGSLKGRTVKAMDRKTAIDVTHPQKVWTKVLRDWNEAVKKEAERFEQQLTSDPKNVPWYCKITITEPKSPPRSKILGVCKHRVGLPGDETGFGKAQVAEDFGIPEGEVDEKNDFAIQGVWSPKVEFLKKRLGNDLMQKGAPNGRKVVYECVDKKISMGGHGAARDWSVNGVTCRAAEGLTKEAKPRDSTGKLLPEGMALCPKGDEGVVDLIEGVPMFDPRYFPVTKNRQKTKYQSTASIPAYEQAVTHCCVCGGGVYASKLTNHLIPFKVQEREGKPVVLNEYKAPSLWAYWQDVNEAIDRSQGGPQGLYPGDRGTWTLEKDPKASLYEDLADLEPFSTQVFQDQVKLITGNANSEFSWSKVKKNSSVPAKIKKHLKTFEALLDQGYVEQFVWTSNLTKHLDKMLASAAHNKSGNALPYCEELRNSPDLPRPEMLVTFDAFRRYWNCRKSYARDYQKKTPFDLSELEKEEEAKTQLPGPIVEKYIGRWTKYGKKWMWDLQSKLLVQEKSATDEKGRQLAQEFLEKLASYDLTFMKITACKDYRAREKKKGARHNFDWEHRAGSAEDSDYTCKRLEEFADLKGGFLPGTVTVKVNGDEILPGTDVTEEETKTVKEHGKQMCCVMNSKDGSLDEQAGEERSNDAYSMEWNKETEAKLCVPGGNNFADIFDNDADPGESSLDLAKKVFNDPLQQYLSYNVLRKDATDLTLDDCKEYCEETDGCTAISYSNSAQQTSGSVEPMGYASKYGPSRTLSQCFLFESCDSYIDSPLSSIKYENWKLTTTQAKVTPKQWNGLKEMEKYFRLMNENDKKILNAVDQTGMQAFAVPPDAMFQEFIKEKKYIAQAKWWSSEVTHTFGKRKQIVQKHKELLPDDKINQVYVTRKACTDAQIPSGGNATTGIWTDVYGHDCKWYLDNNACVGAEKIKTSEEERPWYWAGHPNQEQLDRDPRFFSSRMASDGESALMKCCVCGADGIKAGPTQVVVQREVSELLNDKKTTVLGLLQTYIDYLNSPGTAAECGEIQDFGPCKENLRKIDYYVLKAVRSEYFTSLSESLVNLEEPQTVAKLLERKVEDAYSSIDIKNKFEDSLQKIGVLEEAGFDVDAKSKITKTWQEQCGNIPAALFEQEFNPGCNDAETNYCRDGDLQKSLFEFNRNEHLFNKKTKVEATLEEKIAGISEMWKSCCACGGGKRLKARWRETPELDVPIGGMIGNIVDVVTSSTPTRRGKATYLWVLLWKVENQDASPRIYFVKKQDLIDDLNKPALAEDQVDTFTYHQLHKVASPSEVGLASGMDCMVDAGASKQLKATLIRGDTTAQQPEKYWAEMDASDAVTYKLYEGKSTDPYAKLVPGLVLVDRETVMEPTPDQVRSQKDPHWECGQEVRTRERVEVNWDILNRELQSVKDLVTKKVYDQPDFFVSHDVEGNFIRFLYASEYAPKTIKYQRLPNGGYFDFTPEYVRKNRIYIETNYERVSKEDEINENVPELNEQWVFVRMNIRDDGYTIPLPYKKLIAVDAVDYTGLRPGEEVEVYEDDAAGAADWKLYVSLAGNSISKNLDARTAVVQQQELEERVLNLFAAGDFKTREIREKRTDRETFVASLTKLLENTGIDKLDIDDLIVEVFLKNIYNAVLERKELGGSKLGVLVHREHGDKWYVKVFVGDEFDKGLRLVKPGTPLKHLPKDYLSEKYATFQTLQYTKNFDKTKPTPWRKWGLEPQTAMPVRIEDPNGHRLGAEFENLHGMLIGRGKEFEDSQTAGSMWKLRVWLHSGVPKDYVMPLDTIAPDFPPLFLEYKDPSRKTKLEQLYDSAYLTDLHRELLTSDKVQKFEPGQHVIITGNSNYRTGLKSGIFREAILIADNTLVQAIVPKLYEKVDLDGKPYWPDVPSMGNRGDQTFLTPDQVNSLRIELRDADTHMWLVGLLNSLGDVDPVIVPYADFAAHTPKVMESDETVAASGTVVRINGDINRDAHFGAIVGYDASRKLFSVATPLMSESGRFTKVEVTKLKRSDIQVIRKLDDPADAQKGEFVRLVKDSTLDGDVLVQAQVWASGQVHGKKIYIAQKACWDRGGLAIGKLEETNPDKGFKPAETCQDYLDYTSPPQIAKGKALCDPDGDWVGAAQHVGERTVKAPANFLDEDGAMKGCCVCGGGKRLTIDIKKVDTSKAQSPDLSEADWILLFGDQVETEKSLKDRYLKVPDNTTDSIKKADGQGSWLRRAWEAELTSQRAAYEVDHHKRFEKFTKEGMMPEDDLHRQLLEAGVGINDYKYYQERHLFYHDPGLLAHNMRVSLDKVKARNLKMQRLAKLAEEGASKFGSNMDMKAKQFAQLEYKGSCLGVELTQQREEKEGDRLKAFDLVNLENDELQKNISHFKEFQKHAKKNHQEVLVSLEKSLKHKWAENIAKNLWNEWGLSVAERPETEESLAHAVREGGYVQIRNLPEGGDTNDLKFVGCVGVLQKLPTESIREKLQRDKKKVDSRGRKIKENASQTIEDADNSKCQVIIEFDDEKAGYESRVLYVPKSSLTIPGDQSVDPQFRLSKDNARTLRDLEQMREQKKHKQWEIFSGGNESVTGHVKEAKKLQEDLLALQRQAQLKCKYINSLLLSNRETDMEKDLDTIMRERKTEFAAITAESKEFIPKDMKDQCAMQQNWALTEDLGMKWSTGSAATGDMHGLSNHEGENAVWEVCNEEDPEKDKVPGRPKCMVDGRLTHEEVKHVARFFGGILEAKEKKYVVQVEKKDEEIEVDDVVEAKKAYIWKLQGAEKAASSGYFGHCWKRESSGVPLRLWCQVPTEKAPGGTLIVPRIQPGQLVSEADFSNFLDHKAPQREKMGILDARDSEEWIEYLRQPPKNSIWDESRKGRASDEVQNSALKDEQWIWTAKGATWANGFLPGPESPNKNELTECRFAVAGLSFGSNHPKSRTPYADFKAEDCSITTYMKRAFEAVEDFKGELSKMQMPSYVADEYIPKKLTRESSSWLRQQLKSLSYAEQVLKFIKRDYSGKKYEDDTNEYPNKAANERWYVDKARSAANGTNWDYMWNFPRANILTQYMIPKMAVYGYPVEGDETSKDTNVLKPEKHPYQDLDWDRLAVLPDGSRQLVIESNLQNPEDCGVYSATNDDKTVFFKNTALPCGEKIAKTLHWGICTDDPTWEDKDHRKCEQYYKERKCDVLYGFALESDLHTSNYIKMDNEENDKNAYTQCCRCMDDETLPRKQNRRHYWPDKSLYQNQFISAKETFLWLGKYTSDHTMQSAETLSKTIVTWNEFLKNEKVKRRALRTRTQNALKESDYDGDWSAETDKQKKQSGQYFGGFFRRGVK